MKAVLLVFLLVVCAVVLAAPLEEHIRRKRFTCDVLGSVSIKDVQLNDAPCALHCLWDGKSGGHCDDSKVCICRD
ncbi:Tenecin-1 [Blattella germanica]|nr:Tenecin-1 [Blattella germanica]